MLEGRSFSVVLLSGGFSQWGSAVTPLLLVQTDCLVIVESVDELLSLEQTAPVEMFVICHCPGVYDGIAAAKLIREVFPVTPLVLLAIENTDTLKDALVIGALSILEPPFAGHAVTTAFERCRRLAGALKEDALRGRDNVSEVAAAPETSTADWLESAQLSYGDITVSPEPQPVPGGNDLTSYQIPDPVADISLSRDNCSVPLSSLNILVAEDLPMLQTTIKHTLESIGCRFVIVNNGKEVLDELEKGGFDVVLMDLRMPVMDGFATARHIRQREQISGARIPIVALSSYSLKDIMDKCLEIGMDSYLVKPVEQKKLEETLRWLIIPNDVSEQSESALSSLNGLPVLETHATLENLGFDLEFYRELIHIYLETCAGLGDDLAGILADTDLKYISSTAHSLKGIVANIGGLRLAEVARQIQEMSHLGKKPVVSVWAPLVRAESAALKAAMETINWDELMPGCEQQQ
jgi:CheY-like chemotaxis protein